MDLQRIFNLEGEDEQYQVDDEVTLHNIMAQYFDIDFQDKEAIPEDVEPPPVILLRHIRHFEAVQLLQRFQEHQPTTRNQDIRHLQQLERQLCTFSTS